MVKRYYAGVGSRETPLYIMYMMSELAMIFEKKGFILRSGCAVGADAAFEDALVNPAKTAEIYVPDKSFPFRMGGAYKNYYLVPELIHGLGIDGLYSKATRMIHNQDIHKAWKYCKPYAMKLHNRNMFQVLGQDLATPAKFIVCFTKGQELTYDDTNIKTGGTGTAINAAYLNNIEVFNLSVDAHYLRLRKFIDENKSLIDYDRLNKIKPRTEKYNEVNKYNKFIHAYGDLMPTIQKERLARENKIKIKQENENKQTNEVGRKPSPKM